MALNNLGLGFVFTARDRATGTIRSVGNAFDQQTTRMRLSSGLLQGALVGLGASVATFAAGAAGLRGAFASADMAGEFGQTIARIGALTRATTEELGALRDTAIQAGIETQFSPQEAAEGLAELGVRGFTANESMTALSGTLDLAAGGGISVAQASQTVGSALRVFGLEADQAGFATDRLLRISNVTALQANDLALALGNVSRGAGQTQQSLEEMLPAIGLVRNTGVEASVASNSVSSALQFMARNADQFSALGVEVTDADGNFRQFLDIVLETNEALGERFPNTAERAQEALSLFGRFGVSAFTAISQQATAGIRNAEGQIVRGAEAIDFLRESMENADGAAEEFREQLLDTFAGQQVLLEGTLQTLQTVFGESFAQVFRPFVTGLTTVLNMVIQVFNSIPEEGRTAIATFITLVSGLVAAAGAAGTLGFAIALVLPFLKIVAITMGIIAVVLAPVIAGVLALGASFGVLFLAVRENVGGLGDFFEEQFGRVRLAFNALRQLFTDGAFSGEVMAEMQDAENQGLRSFVITLFRVGSRVLAFFEAIRKGFSAGLEAMAPAAEALGNAVMELGRALGFVEEGAEGVANTGWQGWVEAGVDTGRFFADVLTVVIDVIRRVVQFVTGFIKQVRRFAPIFKPVFAGIADAIGDVVAAFGNLFGQTQEMQAEGRNGSSAAESLGETFVQVIVPAVYLVVGAFALGIRTIAFFVEAVAGVVLAVRTGFGLMEGFIAKLVAAFMNLGDHVTIIMEGIVAEVLGMIRQIPGPVRDALGLGGDTGQALAQREQDALTAQRTARARIGLRTATADRLAAEALPATAETRARADAATRQQGVNVQALARELGRQPLQVRSQLVVDGQVLAEASKRANRDAGATGFDSAATTGFAED